MLWRKRLWFINLNVNVAVNVNTNMSITHVKMRPVSTTDGGDGGGNNMNITTTASTNSSNATNTNDTDSESEKLVTKGQIKKGGGGGRAAGGAAEAPTILSTAISNTSTFIPTSAVRAITQHANHQQQHHKQNHYRKQRNKKYYFGQIPFYLIINSISLLLLLFRCNFVSCQMNLFPSLGGNIDRNGGGIGVTSVATRIRFNISNATTTTTTTTTTTSTGNNHEFDNDDNSAEDDQHNAMIESITHDCIERCNAEENTFLDEFGIQCHAGETSAKCYNSRCTKGCELWWRALKEFEPCPEACSSTQFYPFDMPCIISCETTQRHYWHSQRLTMESLMHSTRPQLLNDSLTASTLTLQWPIASLPIHYLASRPFNIQYQYAAAEDDENIWSNLADYNCNENFDCEIIDGLIPYTKYRFRFEISFGDNNNDVIYSPATDIYQTFAAGAPISKPSLTEVLHMDDSHIAVFWNPGKFVNGPLTGYKLILQSDHQNITFEQLASSHINHYVFGELLPTINYTLHIAMLNEEGVGPYAVTHFQTAESSSPLSANDNLNVVLIAGEYSIRLKDLQPLGETRIIYHGEQLISDFDLHMSAQHLYVVDVDGLIRSLHLDNPGEGTPMSLNRSSLGFKAMKISVDWLNRRLYLAGESSVKTWNIASTDLDGSSLQMLTTNLIEPIQQLEVDPLNGWLFWTSSNDGGGGGMLRMNLATGNVENILENVKVGYFMNKHRDYLLLFHNMDDDEFYELSYDGHYRRIVQMGFGNRTTRMLHGDIQSFHHFPMHLLLATNGTHVMLQNYQRNENDVWHIKDMEWCWKVIPMQQLQQQNSQQHQQYAGQQQQQLFQVQPTPTPTPNMRPRRLQALLTSNMAKIAWLAPARSGFQTEHAWQHWEYEMEIMDVASNSAFNIRNIKTTYFNVEKLQANNLYKLRVRATYGIGTMPAFGEDGAGASAASEWSEELQTRTWPLGEHKFIWTSPAGLYETNEIGTMANRLDVDLAANIRNFVQLNGTTIYYIHNANDDVDEDDRNSLRCANIMNPEVNCSFMGAPNAIGVAYDWRGGKIYWTDRLRNCVIRSNLDGSERELLQIFDALDIEIDSLNGHIYYTTGTRLARRTLSGNFEMDDVEYFHMNGFGGMIRGFALDLRQRQIFWIVRQNEGRVRLFKTSLVLESGHQRFPSSSSSLAQSATGQKVHAHNLEDTLLEHDIEPGSLIYLNAIESLIWLQLNSTKAVIMRALDLLSPAAIMDVPELMKLNAVRLRTDYTPRMDESVRPEAVDIASIRIDDGYWDDFNIKWTSIGTAENYTVFYKVLLEYGDVKKTRFYTMEVMEPFLRITEFHQPQLLLNISIKAYTYWQAGPTVSTQLRTPAAAPTQPKRLRVFVQRRDEPLQLAPNITAFIRWDPPENVSISAEIAYKVYCWYDEELFAEHFHNFSSDRPLESTVDQLNADETYTFQVQAFAAGRASGGEKTAFHAVHIKPEVQSVPQLVYTTSEYIAELDLDLSTRKILFHTTSEIEHLAIMRGEQRFIWVNENVELISFVPGSQPVKLARMRAEVLSLAVDWISRIIYWAEMDTEVEQTVSIFKLPLCQFEGRVMLGTKLLNIGRGRLLRDLLILPFSQALLWLEFDEGERNATLMGRNITDLSLLQFKHATFVNMFEGSFMADMESVNLIDYRGKICAYDVMRQMCNPLKMHFNTLADGIIDIDRDSGYIYALRNDSIRAYNRRKQHLDYVVDIADVHKMRAYNFQPYPERKCMLPETEETLRRRGQLEPIVVALEEDFMTLSLPRVNMNEDCWLEVPGVRYAFTLYGNGNKTRNFTCYERFLNITQLQPFTNYTMKLIATTYYQERLELPALESKEISVRTAAGTPEMPQNFTALALSPSEIIVRWDAPLKWNADRIWYQLHWLMLKNSSLSAHRRLDETEVTLTNLEPSQEYTIWLKVFSTEMKYNETAPSNVQTYDRPAPLELRRASAYNLTLGWHPSANLSSIALVYRLVGGDMEISMDITDNSSEDIIVSNLEPKSKYEFYLELTYNNVARPYNWPEAHNERFTYETLGDCPSSPGTPQVEHITGEIFKVFWEPARNNGAPVLEYSLEALQARGTKRKRRDAAFATQEERVDERRNSDSDRSSETNNNNRLQNKMLLLNQLPWAEEPRPLEDNWIVYCNTTELSCIVRELHTLRLLMFRVRARNEPYGWGPYSADSERVSEPFVTPQKRITLVYAIIAPAAIVSSCVIVLVFIRIVQKRRLKAKKLLAKSRPSIWSNFSEIQRQQYMGTQNRAYSVTSHSTLYTGGPLSDADIALLPNISWSQITVLNFLGSGAFGEVYEGIIKHENDEHEKVAIKNLRKGCSESAELLQEAQLMSNFKHENIVRLIGVCFDTEAISIIMEHMEGGDLLSYLRESRPNSNRPVASLQLLDLMTMCIDVATGCSYLEDMHFVHRDLACRNCLVSSRVPSKRVVKIGDFGLARDIYKSDYYRKEGEGLLPVRWMAPESLVDGVFTTQSDVWAFAVLCWEILTLGQQPYAARNNFEVLNYVREGGRLEQPENCPDKFFILLLQCWETDADERPSFRKCLNTLLNIKTDVRRVSLGYNMDDADYPLYANNQGVILSSFLANPLPKVIEEEDDADAEDDDETASIKSMTNKLNAKVHFIDTIQDIEYETASDASQLIEDSRSRSNGARDMESTIQSFYINEGVSRL